MIGPTTPCKKLVRPIRQRHVPQSRIHKPSPCRTWLITQPHYDRDWTSSCRIAQYRLDRYIIVNFIMREYSLPNSVGYCLSANEFEKECPNMLIYIVNSS